MKLYEYQAKEIFKKYGIPVQRFGVVEKLDSAKNIAENLGYPIVIKAQVKVAGRGKAGGIKIAKTEDELQKFAGDILSMNIKGVEVKKIIICEAVEIEEEYYFALTIDRSKRSPVLILSTIGGIDIEEVAEKNPDKIIKEEIDILEGLRDFKIRKALFNAEFNKELIKDFQDIIKKLYKILIDYDAGLVEINPLAKTKDGRLVAIDAKIIIDDNALFRQKEFQEITEFEEEDELEIEARKRKLPYVKLSGDIGIIGNGAGLVMATMDLVEKYGGEPANFLDFGAGARSDVIKSAVELILLDKRIKGILINIFGGLTRGDEVAKGIISATKDLNLKIPIVIRLTGTKAEEGLEILKNVPYLTTAKSMTESAEKIVEMVRNDKYRVKGL